MDFEAARANPCEVYSGLLVLHCEVGGCSVDTAGRELKHAFVQRLVESPGQVILIMSYPSMDIPEVYRAKICGCK